MEKQFLAFYNHEKYTKIRQELHKIPELGFLEYKTKQFILEYLTTSNIFNNGAKLTEVLTTGFFIDFQGQAEQTTDNPLTIAYRTDLDGLPITEETGLPYTSTNIGCQHACGHDGHITILLAFLEFVSINIKKIPCNYCVRFIFQPAEEGMGGAQKMIEEKCLNNVNEIYGLHNMTLFKVGEIGLIEGTIMARIDKFEINIKGKGGHGSTPHKCHNPISIGANIVTSLNQITSQEIDSNERSVVSIGQFSSGETHNVIPDTGVIKGTIRTITKNTADNIMQRIKKISECQSQVCDSTVDVKFDCPGDLTWNHPEQTKLVEKIINKYFILAKNDLPVMASEDFSFYQKVIPGCFFMLGCADETHKGYLHTSAYDFNDRSILVGVEMYIRILEEKFNLNII